MDEIDFENILSLICNFPGRNPEEKELLAKYLLQRILDREAAEAGSSVIFGIIIIIIIIILNYLHL